MDDNDPHGQDDYGSEQDRLDVAVELAAVIRARYEYHGIPVRVTIDPVPRDPPTWKFRINDRFAIESPQDPDVVDETRADVRLAVDADACANPTEMRTM